MTRRVVNHAILTLFASTLAYVLASLTLDPTARYLGRNPRPSDAAIAAILDEQGTNPQVPLVQRTWSWLRRLVWEADLGRTADGVSVRQEILERAGVSLQLLLAGAILGTLLGLALGVYSAVRQHHAADHVVTYLSFLVLATPVFVIGVLLMIVATDLNDLLGVQLIQFTGPYTPGLSDPADIVRDRISHLLLPTLALTLTGAATYSRYQRNAMLDVLADDHLRTARAKGCTRLRALLRHGVRVALIPVATFLAYTFGLLLAGSTFLEIVFSWHGMGEFTLDAVTGNDINAAAGATCYFAVLVLIASTFAEVLTAALDPRARR